MKKLFLLLALLGMVAVGCSKDDTDKDNDNKTEQPNENEGGGEDNIPENIFFGLDKESVTISPDGGSVDVVVYSNYKWEISGTSDWCTPSVKSGDANEDGQKVTFSADIAYDDREATFWFRCADKQIKFVVSQKFKEAIIPDANNTFNIPAEGGVAVISYQTNIDCEVIIPEEAQDWITIAPASRGLVSENINLYIAENTTYSARTAVIKVVAKDNAELVVEYTINQEQNDAVLADENNTFTVPSAGGDVAINYQTNIDCEVIIPEEAQDWITTVPASRGLSTYSTTLNVAENTTYSARTAVVKVVAKDNAELVIEYTINQEQNDAVLANGNTEFTIDGREQQITIEHKANVDCDVVIPDEAQDWVAIAPATRGLSTYSTTLNIAENNSGKERSCVVKVTSQGDNELSAEYIIIQKPRYCLYYTSNDGKRVQPYSSSAFDAPIVFNTYIDGVGVIAFDAPISTIGWRAFYNCSNLTSITIPDSVTTIGSGAFYDCSSLTSVYISDIAAWCNISFSGSFSNPFNLYLNNELVTDLTIPDSVTTIGELAFFYCSSLTSVTIPDSVTTIGDYAFARCTSLESVTIPNSVTTIGARAFYKCASLTSVTIGGSVTTIGDKAFSNCSSLTSITIPDSVTKIGVGTFDYCSSLQEFKGKFASENGRCLIIDGTFNSFAPRGLVEYTIPDSVTTIGEYVFGGCSSLTSVTIPDSVTTIGEWAFNGCSSLTSVTIPDSVTTIGDYAFSYCSSLTSVYCKPTTPPVALLYYNYWHAFYDNASGRKIYVPMESVEAYKSASGWSKYASAIEGYDF